MRTNTNREATNLRKRTSNASLFFKCECLSTLVAYLVCTRVCAVSKKLTTMCFVDTILFANGSGLVLANELIYPNSEIFVQVVNFADKPVFVKHGTRVASLTHCEQHPYSISKSISSNSLNPSKQSKLKLKDLDTDVSELSKSESGQLQALLDKYQH